MRLFISCEHGGNRIPDKYRHLFKDADTILNSYQGYDIGAFELYKTLLHNKEVDFSIHNEISKLLVDCNCDSFRSNLYSSYTKYIYEDDKKHIFNNYYFPYRNTIFKNVNEVISQGERVIHISLNTFSPSEKGKIRDADIGILFNSQHRIEKYIAKYWRDILYEIFPSLSVRFNYPSLGKMEGITAPLRKEYNDMYMGFELELNNKYAGNSKIYEGVKTSVLKLKKQMEFYYGSK